jgi:hypothetical protein
MVVCGTLAFVLFADLKPQTGVGGYSIGEGDTGQGGRDDSKLHF